MNNDINKTYSIIHTPDSQDIYEQQREDAMAGISMYDLTTNTLNKYSAYPDSRNISVVDSFLRNGVDNSVTKGDTWLTTSSVGGGELSIKYPNTTSGGYIDQEKRRIQSQAGSMDYTRKDHFAIGTVYLSIPPTQISVSEEAHNHRFGTLRSPGESIVTSGRSTTRIDLEIVFSGFEDINNKLRPLLAQIKTTPFLPIESEYLRKILNPFDRKLVDPNTLKSKKYQLHEMEARKKVVDDLIETSARTKELTNEMYYKVDELEKKGWITSAFSDELKLEGILIDPEKIPAEKRSLADYDVDEYQVSRISLSKYIGRHMDVRVPRNPDMIGLTRNLNDIDALSAEINELKQRSEDLGIKNAEDRFTDRQLMCVLSQMAISTMPGFPDSLGCRLSLYLFNYEPFSLDAAFISGYNKDAATPDITKCDLFIDWYTTRWLSERNDPERPTLGWYTGDQTTEFVYVTKFEATSKDKFNPNVINKGSILVNNGLHVSGITVSIKNVIQFIPILSSKSPTCQYMGSISSDVQFMLESTNEDKVIELSKMVDKIRTISRTGNRATRSNFIYVRNNFLQFLAMPYFSIDNYSVDTVPGSPGLQSIALNLVEFKPEQEGLQELKREGVTNQDEIFKTAKWMLQKAHDYMVSGGPTGANSQYKEIYDQVMDKNTGWFKKNNSIVTQFMRGIGAQDDDLKEDRMLVNARTGEYRSIQTHIDENPNIIGPKQIVLLDYESYSRKFVDSLNNIAVKQNPADPIVVNFESDVDLIARILVVMKRDELVRRILNPTKNPEINEELNRNRKKEDLDAGKIYCYPDLELPRYGEIPDGLRMINTDLSSGKQGSSISNPKPAQSDFAMVDPDFFFYKGSLWGKLDFSNELFNSVNAGIKTYNSLAYSNSRFRKDTQISDRFMAKLISDIHNDRMRVGEDTINGLSSSKFDTAELDGKVVEVTGVLSGSEIAVVSNGRTLQVELEGVVPGAFNQKAKTALTDYLAGKKVRIDLAGKTKDGTKYRGWVHVINGDNYKNVNNLMMERSQELKLQESSRIDDPLSSYNSMLFFRSHDLYAKNESGKVFGIKLLGNIPVVSSVHRVRGALLSLAKTAAAAAPDKAKGESYDAIGIAAYSLQTKRILGAALTNDIGSLPGDTDEFEPTKSSGINRFDREAEHHIKLIADRIRQSQKDNVLRMSRAFPAFAVYFIEEDMPEWGRWDDKYRYQAVTSIDVTKSRTEAADVAVIKFINTRGSLDRSYFGIHDADGGVEQRQNLEALKTKAQETREEQSLDQFVLKPGTVIKIKMGYSADPDLLDTVFTGMISEVSGGDVLEVVAQGFGVELLLPVKEYSYQVHAASAFKVLDKLLRSPHVVHFGKTKWFAEQTAVSRRFYRRSIPDPLRPGEYIGASWWRNIGGFKHFLGVRDDTRDNNIWAPENSWLYNIAHGGTQTFITKGKSIWDTFRDMMRRMPGYITTVLPFDNRATIYFGPADFLYWATDQNQDDIQAWKNRYREAVDIKPEDKIKAMLASGEIKEKDPTEFNKELEMLSKHVTDIYKRNGLTNWIPGDDVKVYIGALNGLFKEDETPALSSPITGILFNIGRNAEIGMFTDTALSFAKIRAQSGLTSKSSDLALSKLYDLTALSIQARDQESFSAEYKSSGASIKYIGTKPVYVKKDGTLYLERDALNWFDRTRSIDHENGNPARKLVRQYHYKDSFHHIIANSIVATANYLHNRVTVEFGNEHESDDKDGATTETTSRFKKVSAQVDDDIWPERVKERLVNEKNANDVVVAWNYALGNLWEEMRKMYSGHLVMMGDGAIRPYDIVMMSDYFTDMHGPVEVEQVTHHFSPGTGFITTIVPNLVCHVNNSLQQGSLVVAGTYMDATTKLLSDVRSEYGLGGLLGPVSSWLGNSAANITFWANTYSAGVREPMSFSPLIYSGRPFVAGVEGMRKTNIYEAISGNIDKFVLQRNRIMETIGEVADQAIKLFGNGMQKP